MTTSDGLIIATAVGDNPLDTPTFVPMLGKAVAAAALLAAHRPEPAADRDGEEEDDEFPDEIGVLLADAGYLSDANLTATGPDRLIATAKSRKLPKDTSELPEPGEDATAIERMTYRLASPEGRALYRQRSHIAETPFGHAKHNLRFRQFTGRGIARAAGEFAFHGMVHNMMKLIRSGRLVMA